MTFCFWRRCGDSNPRSLVKDLHDFQSCSFGQLGHICKYCFDIITYQSKKSNNYLALFLTSSSFAKYTEREVKAKSIFISSARVLTSQLNFDLKVILKRRNINIKENFNIKRRIGIVSKIHTNIRFIAFIIRKNKFFKF